MTLGRAPGIMQCSGPALVLAALLLAPFHNKAFTVDDPTFLTGATHMLVDPLHPSAFEMVWNDPYRMRASEMFSNSPVAYCLLVPTILAGGAEWVAHLTQFLIFAVGICGAASLSLRLGFTNLQARYTTLLLAATPAVLGMAGTAMPDIPAMTFAVVSMDRLLAFKLSRRWTQGLAASLFLLIGMLCRGHLILLAGVGAIALWNHDESSKPLTAWLHSLWPLALAPILMFVVLWSTRDPLAESAGMFSAPLNYSVLDAAARNLIAYLTHWVLVIPLAIPWLILRFRHLPFRLLWPLVPIIVGLVLAEHSVSRWTAPIAVLAAIALADILLDGWQRRDFTQLFLLSWLLIPVVVVPYVHLPSKYLVACAPAAAMLVASRITRQLLGVTLAAGVLLGILILSADAKLAGLWRQGAAQMIAPRVQAGETVWFAGSWGFYWYAEKAGAKVLSLTAPYPKPGDIVVVNSSWLRDETSVIQRHTVLESSEDASPGGRIFGGFGRAGFYSNGYGSLPWTIGRDAITRFEVWRVD